jgi:hypothetical protein
MRGRPRDPRVVARRRGTLAAYWIDDGPDDKLFVLLPGVR